MVWYLALPPEETIIKGKNKDNIKEEDLNKEKLTQLKNEITRTHEVENGPARWCVYTKNFSKMILGCENGFISILPIEGEMEIYRKCHSSSQTVEEAYDGN